MPFPSLFPPIVAPAPAGSSEVEAASLTAMDDWKRVVTFDFGNSFGEFKPPPPASPPSIASATVTQTIGATQLGVPIGPRFGFGQAHNRRWPRPWYPLPMTTPIPPGAPLTIASVTPLASTVTCVISGGLAGETYDLKCKVLLSTGDKLSILLQYTIGVPGTAPITPQTLTHLIDPTDDTTWTRDYNGNFNTFAELQGSSPPAIATPGFVGAAGVVNLAPIASGTKVAVRIYCSQAGQYPLRFRATLGDAIGTQLSVPWILNAVLGEW